jgi:steroid delta-isomerase-like uncharacterized protein
MAPKNVQTIKAVHDAFNDRDWDAIRRMIADECVFIDGRGTSHKGPDAFALQYAKPWADAFSDGKITDAKYYDAGNAVATEFTGRGTNDGTLGPLPPTGRRADLPYCEIYEFNAEGKIVSGRAYFDQLTLLIQLGHAQAPPT